MEQQELEARIKNIDERTRRIEERTARIEQTFLTKDDARAFATKADLQVFATKDDLQPFVTKDDLQSFVTKDDLQLFATKDDVREEGERTRRHFDIVGEKMLAGIAIIAEGHEATKDYVAGQLTKVEATLSSHNLRITKLEANSIKRRK